MTDRATSAALPAPPAVELIAAAKANSGSAGFYLRSFEFFTAGADRSGGQSRGCRDFNNRTAGQGAAAGRQPGGQPRGRRPQDLADCPPQTRLGRGAQGVEFRGDSAILLDRRESRLSVAGTDQKAGQRVVVLLRQGVELVVVAAGAADGQRQERLAHHIQAVVHAIRLVLADIHGRVHFLTQEPEARAQDRFVFVVWPQPRGDQVSGQMLADKLVIGDIRIQCANHVVPVLPGVGDRRIEFVAARLGVSDQIQPVPRPPLAKVR